MVREPLAQWLGLETRWVFAAVLVSAGLVIVNLRLGQWQVAGRQALRCDAGRTDAGEHGVVAALRRRADAGGGRAHRRAGARRTRLRAPRPGAASQGWPALAALAREDAREALAFGVPLVPHVAGLFVLNAADRLVINKDLGLAQAGVYMVAVQITMAMAIVFDAINRAYVPWLFARLAEDDPADKRNIVRWTYAGFAGALALAALAFLVGPPVTRWLAGDAFAGAGAVVGWLALGQAFAGMYLLVTNYLFFARRTGLLSMATVAAGALHIALLLVLVPRHGLKGAAWSFAIAMGARFLLTWVVAQKSHPMPWFNARKVGSAPGSAE